MATVTEAIAAKRDYPVFICDFSPPRGARSEYFDDARALEADFICVAYNPGKAVRVDSVAAAHEIKRVTGRDAVFNLSPRDMNRLALESRLLGAELLGLQNVVVVQGDAFTERDPSTAVNDYTATGLIAAIARLNGGTDHKDSRLRAPTRFAIGAAIDLGRGIGQEARLARRKVEAGAQFFITQPVFTVSEIEDFLDAYSELTSAALAQPVFWGLQILTKDGVLFSNVPADLTRDLEQGRDGVDIALESYALFREAGLQGIYLVSPILRGGARDYTAAQRFLREVRSSPVV
jgi:5,10-methylenetetrahydrofolate reductase